jgi:hypothetical protein
MIYKNKEKNQLDLMMGHPENSFINEGEDNKI